MKYLIALCLISASALADDYDYNRRSSMSGYDYTTNSTIDMQSNVKPGQTVQIYDSKSGYKDVDVQGVRDYGGAGKSIDVYDPQTRSYTTIDAR